MLRLRKLFLIYIIFTLLGCKKTAVKPSETTTPEYSETTTQEYSETQESTDIKYLWEDDEAWAKYISSLNDPQTSNKMLIDSLEKENKTISYLSPIDGNFSDFTPFLAFKNLETLDIDNDYITDISGITVLSKNEKLSKLILWAEKVTDISPLSALVNLRFLNIDVDNTCTNASELLPLINLESLVFKPVSSETIRNISKLTRLNYLYLGLDYEGLDISPVKNLINLEKLTIRAPLHKYPEINISWMSQLVNLQELKLVGFNITDVNPLLKLPNIKEIDVMFSEISDENIALLKKTGAVVYTHADADH